MKKYKFNLERALAGEPLVTEDGKIVTEFKKRDNRITSDSHPYVATFNRYTTLDYTASGEWIAGKFCKHNLYMKYPPLPPKDTYILVKNNNKEHWEKRMFLYRDKNGFIITVSAVTEKSYLRGEYYSIIVWKQWKPIEEKPNIEITVKINGKNAKLSDISDETLKKLRELE